jgi:hypothetical protein
MSLSEDRAMAGLLYADRAFPLTGNTILLLIEGYCSKFGNTIIYLNNCKFKLPGDLPVFLFNYLFYYKFRF